MLSQIRGDLRKAAIGFGKGEKWICCLDWSKLSDPWTLSTAAEMSARLKLVSLVTYRTLEAMGQYCIEEKKIILHGQGKMRAKTTPWTTWRSVEANAHSERWARLIVISLMVLEMDVYAGYCNALARSNPRPSRHKISLPWGIARGIICFDCHDAIFP